MRSRGGRCSRPAVRDLPRRRIRRHMPCGSRAKPGRVARSATSAGTELFRAIKREVFEKSRTPVCRGLVETVALVCDEIIEQRARQATDVLANRFTKGVGGRGVRRTIVPRCSPLTAAGRKSHCSLLISYRCWLDMFAIGWHYPARICG